MRNWIGSAQDRDYWRALVDTALKLRVCLCVCLAVDNVAKFSRQLPLPDLEEPAYTVNYNGQRKHKAVLRHDYKEEENSN